MYLKLIKNIETLKKIEQNRFLWKTEGFEENSLISDQKNRLQNQCSVLRNRIKSIQRFLLRSDLATVGECRSLAAVVATDLKLLKEKLKVLNSALRC